MNLIQSLTFVISISLLFQYCSASGTLSVDSEEYLPLAIGNKWFYSFSNSNEVSDIVEVISIDTIVENEYFVIKNSRIGHGITREFLNYQRISNDTLFSLIYSEERQRFFEIVDAIFSLDSSDIVFINIDINTSGSAYESKNEKIFLESKYSIMDKDSLQSTNDNSFTSLPFPMRNYSIRVLNKHADIIEFLIKYQGVENEFTKIYKKGVGLIPTKGTLIKYEIKH